MSARQFKETAANADIASVRKLLKNCEVDDLQMAAANGDKKEVGKLLRKRAIIQKLRDRNVNKADRASIEKMLTERLDINVGTGGLGNALHAASFKIDPALQRNNDSNEKRLEIIRLLIENGANINKETGMHGTALIAASNAGNEDIVQLLLEEGADPNANGRKFANALQGATAGGHVKIVELLIKNGANLEGKVLQDTLEMASDRGYMPIVKCRMW
ncbi:Pfs, NACHT and Ankyrin domain protein [Stemphylium lycopersici]|nr:hypothetical protein TW65_09303 [Stemphylium lycopersici]RAQ93875.1 Pfs, NACHT and Ankyrin domain protein [Stemphylium lycopersici]